MPYNKTIKPGDGIEIAIWHLTEELPALLQLWGNAPLPSHFETAKAYKRQREILATALLLRQHFGKDIALSHTPDGAPIIQQGYISISHTLNHIAIALHPLRKVGIDIEAIGNRATRVAPRFLSTDELTALPAENTILPDGSQARNIAIHLIWSIKEATFKIQPLTVEFRKDIVIAPIASLPQGSTTVTLTATNTTYKAHYTIYDGCSLAWIIA